MGRKIAIVSGKGGVGKTTITFGIGLSLARRGRSVCLVDLDVGLNNLDMIFNAENKVIYDLNDCLEGKCRIKQALVSYENQENFYILSSSKCDINTEISDYKLGMLINKLASVFDFVLIDCSAGITKYFHLGLKCASEALLVVTPHIASIRDADKVISLIKGAGVQFDGAIVNRVRGDLLARGESLSYKQIEYLLKSEIMGVVPESDEINIHSGNFIKNNAKSEVNMAFNIVSQNLDIGTKTIFDCQKKYRGFIGFFRRNIKRSV